jgi:hypothetical protein
MVLSTTGFAKERHAGGLVVPTPSQLDNNLQNFVKVSGFHPGSTAKETVLDFFQRFGSIEMHYQSPNDNCIYIRYSRQEEANRALRMDRQMFNQNMIGVTTITQAELNILEQQQQGQGQGGGPVHRLPPVQQRDSVYTRVAQNYGKYADIDDLDINLAPQRRQNICSRIIEIFFSY